MVRHSLPFLGLLSAVLAGCAAEPLVVAPGFVGAYPLTTTPSGVPISIDVGPARALAALPPAAGPVVAVKETRHPNGVMQEITIGGAHTDAGANGITLIEVMPADPAWRGNSEGNLKIDPVTDTAIGRELEARFPRIAMRMAASYDATAQGPLGYALGKSGSTACIYAWQNIVPPRPLTLAEGASGLGDYPISVRVRLCKALGEAALIDIVRHLAVVRPGYGPVYAPAVATSAPPAADALAAATAGSVAVPASYAGGYRATPAVVTAAPALGGAFVVPGPVMATPVGVLAAPPALSGTIPSPVLAYGAPPLYAAPAYSGLPRPALEEAVGGQRAIRHAGSRPRRTTARRRDSVDAAAVKRFTGPVVPLPSEVAVPAPTAPAAAPRPQGPTAPTPSTSEDALPLPK